MFIYYLNYLYYLLSKKKKKEIRKKTSWTLQKTNQENYAWEDLNMPT